VPIPLTARFAAHVLASAGAAGPSDGISGTDACGTACRDSRPLERPLDDRVLSQRRGVDDPASDGADHRLAIVASWPRLGRFSPVKVDLSGSQPGRWSRCGLQSVTATLEVVGNEAWISDTTMDL
jgi:hypothetical protein